MKEFLKHFARWQSHSETEPLSVWEVLGEEYWRSVSPEREIENSADCEYLEALKRYREKRAQWHTAGKPEDGAAQAEYEVADLAFRRVLIRRLHGRARTALCFSGGGIRSATFGLGVLQGMAAHSVSQEAPDDPPRLLGEVDYLSTVSGGGYLGGWFSSWAARHPQRSAGVIRELAEVPEADWEPEPAPLRYLRKFTSYLNPEVGAFSADTWTLLATVVRNIVLNWLVLLPLLAAVLMLPRLLWAAIGAYPVIENNYILIASAALVSLAVAYMVVDLPSAGDARFPQRRYLIFGLSPLLLSIIGFSLYWAWQGFLDSEPSPAGFVRYGVAIMAAGVLLGMPFAWLKRGSFSPVWMLKGAGFALITGAMGGLLGYWVTRAFTDPSTPDSNLYDDRLYAWLSLPALLGVFAVSQGLLVAMTSSITDDEDREWWSRSTAWIFIAMVCCFGFNGIVLLLPDLAERLPSIRWQSVGTAVAGLLASGIGFSHGTAATKDEKEQARPSTSISQLLLKLASKLILPVFLLLLVILIASFNHAASQQLGAWLSSQSRSSRQYPPSGAIQLLLRLAAWLSSNAPSSPQDPPAPAIEFLLMTLLAVPALLLSRVIDANKFSLHAMYRARLIRTFLGASNKDRKPNPFTGFDPADNIPMTELPSKPLHVVNVTLNLVKGENLAWQQRKAESFTSTRYHTGGCRVGYQRSSDYFGGVTLGGAITISGAAANPNMGYASSPLLSIVMMLFNARLGAWSANPGEAGRDRWSKTSPTYSIRPFIDEAFGLTSDKNSWVNLSDGGHFENLGLYEMVLRRCRTIIVVDGSADPAFHFDDLGNAIRKIRVDMGINIEFPELSITSKITPRSRHCAVGTIGYKAVDGSPADDGVLIYIKSSLTGNEPRDVLNYAKQNPAFPQEPTSDQWFDESQFESYRRLGCHVVDEALRFRKGRCSLQEFTETISSYCALEKKPAADTA
ncbi:MAG: hypothetical protein ACLPY2_11485 [Bryobacteraceae bacterium]|jgi:hypothetical protein